MLLHPSHQPDGSGMFHQAHEFVIKDSLIIEGTTDNNDNFLKEFAEHTLRGAEFDSSERDPPPECHPGTREKIVERIQFWFHNPLRTSRLLWLVGPAGVGKSAIMQTLAEIEAQRSMISTLFFSATQGRNNPSKVIATIAYRIAVQHSPYQEYLRSALAADPKLIETSIKTQFSTFFVLPFVKMKLYSGPSPLIIFIDGLDECEGKEEQLHFLTLISSFTESYPEAPLLWVIASRPEEHITSYLACQKLKSCYDKEEVSVDSTEACEDMERYLRLEFEKIRASNPVIRTLFPHWPPENDFLKLLTAAVGHFAYGTTVIRFISQGDPISRFRLILDLINTTTSTSRAGTLRPMAQLDALYEHLISQVEPEDRPGAKEILGFLHVDSFAIPFVPDRDMPSMCNWLGMAPNVAYSALRQLHSVLDVPPPDAGIYTPIKIYHKSFSDFFCDSNRSVHSGFWLGTEGDRRHCHLSQAFKVFQGIPSYNTGETRSLPYREIILSWLYRDDSDATRKLKEGDQRQMWDLASSAIGQAALSIEEFPLPQNMAGSLGKLLQEDGTLRLIPTGMLKPEMIRRSVERHLYHELVLDGSSELRSIIFGVDDYSHHDKIIQEHFKKAKLRPFSSGNVRVFIGAELQGWVHCEIASLEYDSKMTHAYYFWYGFSSIYDALKKLWEGESGNTSSGLGLKGI
ncbi:hypothetical protein AN958_02611 [Leucoagaricus sp. SymC.cos]|nr:hypothetical protein AN958_02611 [Leucoagaricus sp. SymC.cos]